MLSNTASKQLKKRCLFSTQMSLLLYHLPWQIALFALCGNLKVYQLLLTVSLACSGASAEELRNETFSFIVSICMTLLSSNWTDFLGILRKELLLKSVCKIDVWIKSDKDNWQFTWRPPCIYDHISRFSSWLLETQLMIEIQYGAAAYLLFSCRFTTTTTPWSRRLLEKLTGPLDTEEFPAFYGTRKFITAFTTARHLSLSWLNQSTPRYPTS